MSRKIPYETEKAYLWSIRLFLEKGNIRTVRNQIEQRSYRLRNCTSEEVRDEFRELLQKAEEAYRIEEEHGAGCLLDLDDPINARLIARGAIRADEANAAKRYRSISSNLAEAH